MSWSLCLAVAKMVSITMGAKVSDAGEKIGECECDGGERSKSSRGAMRCGVRERSEMMYGAQWVEV